MSEGSSICQVAELQGFGEDSSIHEPKAAAPETATADGSDADPTRVEAVCDTLTAGIERLSAELVTTTQDLHAARDNVGEEHSRLRDMLASQERNLAAKSTLILERGEMALARAVLAAQQRAKSQACESSLVKRLRGLRELHGRGDTRQEACKREIENTETKGLIERLSPGDFNAFFPLSSSQKEKEQA
jgi:hypothetical protein